MIDQKFWKNKRVLITGHTGFKGSWLSIWLHSLEANVVGYSLEPPTKPSLFETANVQSITQTIYADIRDRKKLNDVIQKIQPEIVFHLAAQPLVRDSYKIPVETYETNVMGTVNLLDAIRTSKSAKAIINITTDKVYENKEWIWGYRENEPFGGYDPYSNSKACSELVTSAFRNSYFNPAIYSQHGIGLASARAGNVIGGGDWATDRIVPDCINALLDNKPINLRNPASTRPWQHVLEPLSGYIILAQSLYNDGARFSEGWNFGPSDEDCLSVKRLVEMLCSMWEKGASYTCSIQSGPHEAHYLKLDCSKAHELLGWKPKWRLETALKKIVEWTRAWETNEDIRAVCLEQIAEYQNQCLAE